MREFLLRLVTIFIGVWIGMGSYRYLKTAYLLELLKENYRHHDVSSEENINQAFKEAVNGGTK